jgi:hypothetical protein
MKRTSRKPSNLSISLQRHLNAYALAASAAGVGVLALAQPAEAKIISTPTHRHIWYGHPALIEFNHRGVVDFTISVHHFTSGGSSYRLLFASGASKGNSVGGIIWSNGSALAYALRHGNTIGPSLRFSGALMAGWRGRPEGSSGSCLNQAFGWNKARNRYLGLRFPVNGQYHYGWARLNESCDRKGNVTALLTGYAYETIPNKPIITGKTKGLDVITLEPGSLGRLAQGSAGRSGK